MLAAKTFGSQREVWGSRGFIPNKYAKAAHLSRLGDLYQPNARRVHDEHDPAAYKPWIKDHKHDEEWRGKDIAARYYDRFHRLLIGDRHYCYAWAKPTEVMRRSFAPKHHLFFKTLNDFTARFR